MGATKTHIFNDVHITIATVAKVLAHPARVAIIQYISRQEDCICNDLVDVIGLSQPTISQHLSEIKKIGLLKGDYKGKNLCYCIDVEKWEELQTIFQGFFRKINQNCC